MIEINLLPEDLRVQKQNSAGDLSYVLYLIPLFASILLFVHLILGIVYLTRAASMGSLNSKFKTLEPQRNKINTFKNETALQFSESNVIKQVYDKQVKWAFKLNKLSLDLPSGIWFNDIIYDSKTLTIKASVVSLKNEQLDLINKFLDGLKSNGDFIKDFNSLDIGPVQRRVIGSFDVLDFLIIGEMKVLDTQKPALKGKK